MLSIETGERYAPLNMSPQRQKEKTIEAIADQAAGIAGHGPVLFIFEDAHWADPTTLEALEAVIARIESSPVLVVITYRPEFEAPWTQAHITQLALSRLAKRQCRDLVAKVTGGKALPDEVLAQIVAKTDGVPLFVEELTKAVLEGGVSEQRAQTSPFAIPATLKDSLMARLDRLGAAKEVAQLGAVIGRIFSYELLSAVSDAAEAELRVALDRLVGAELIFQRGAPPLASYTFKHALVRDAAYESLLRSKRQQLHANIADLAEDRFPEVGEAEPELLGHHWSMAQMPQKAIPYFTRAADQARATYANEEAIAFYKSAIGLANEIIRYDGGQANQRLIETARPYEGLGDVMALTRRHAEARGAYARALDGISEGDGLWRARIHRKLGVMNQEDRKEALRELRIAGALLGEEPMDAQGAWRHEWLAVQIGKLLAYYWQGETGEMEAVLGTVEPFIHLATPRQDRVPARGVRALRSTRLPAGRAGTFRLPRWAA